MNNIRGSKKEEDMETIQVLTLKWLEVETLKGITEAGVEDVAGAEAEVDILIIITTTIMEIKIITTTMEIKIATMEIKVTTTTMEIKNSS